MPLRFVGAFACALFCYVCYWSIRLGFADHIATDRSRATTQQAIRLAPGNPEYYIRLAESDPAVALPAIQIAAALNSLNSNIWIMFAHIAEERKDFQQAESCLLRAVQLDKTFAPRWLLEEYYFRRRDQVHFWPAMRAALAASYDDVTPLFDSCWTFAANPDTILRQAIPDRTNVQRQYLDYVLTKNRLDLAGPVAAKVMEHAAPEDAPSLLSYCDRLLEKKQPLEALEVWNSLSKKRLLDYSHLAPDRGTSITNGNFEKPFLSRGFDWRLADLPGITTRHGGLPATLQFSFSGKQPETCEILSELVPLEPERKYRLSVRYETSQLGHETGLSWRILDSLDASDLLEGAGQLTGKERTEGEQEFAFVTRGQTRLARLVLTYQRVLGTVRIEGWLVLRNVGLGFAE